MRLVILSSLKHFFFHLASRTPLSWFICYLPGHFWVFFVASSSVSHLRTEKCWGSAWYSFSSRLHSLAWWSHPVHIHMPSLALLPAFKTHISSYLMCPLESHCHTLVQVYSTATTSSFHPCGLFSIWQLEWLFKHVGQIMSLLCSKPSNCLHWSLGVKVETLPMANKALYDLSATPSFASAF